MKNMKSYTLEAYGKTSSAVVTLGAREGYEGSKEYSLEELMRMIDELNMQRNSQNLKNLNCIVSEAHLIGRAGDSSYKERLYELKFSQSPRVKAIDNGEFFDIVKEYASALGSSMKQQRVYIEFNGDTYVFKAGIEG
jgi:hypothetical protein